jgi:fatty acid desaturase
MIEAQRKAMPMPDPVPRPDRRPIASAAAWARYRRIMRWMALLGVACVAVALAYFRWGGEPVPLPMAIAASAGIFLTVMVGTGLMMLLFLSHGSGHDDAAADPFDERRE